ncbi:sugar transferase [candidate division KSB1 bacterium]|nr:sugar transferase [candidate division KSB1 bacterium]
MLVDSEKTIQNVAVQPDFPVLAETETTPEVSFAELKTRVLTRLLRSCPGLFDFVDKNLGLSSFDLFESEAGTFPSISSLQRLEKDSLQSFLNLHRFNDFRYLNKYLLEVHEKLIQGGIFIGRGDTLETHKRNFFKTYPPYLSKALYLFHFIYARAMAKLPLLKKIYFMTSGGKNRVISKAEILGRLYFCGFKVLAVEETEENFYFIAKKHTSPSTYKNPSYNFIIKLRRVGLNGQPIFIHKFRTMHPYSEYLQEYVFEHNKLQSNGKFKNDFRVANWGRVMRKYWLDELPQLFNYFLGDINLVGVRALSRHYFSLYPKDLQELRSKYKPGLIPPYYADLPQSFDEILESERQYFSAKGNRSFLTDNLYLVRALTNILLRNARSH